MDVDALFSLSSTTALAGWLALAVTVVSGRLTFLRDIIARLAIPLIFAVLYTALIAGYFGSAKGGFGSLSDVAALFESREILLAGWIHYLAFDLFVGTHLAAAGAREGMPRLVMLPILALTFLFGPAGLLAYFVARPLLRPTDRTQFTVDRLKGVFDV